MKVLIVEDQRDVRVALRRLLRRIPDLEIVEAEDRARASRALESDVDLILLDIRLSEDLRERAGLELLRDLRRMGRNVPAVVVSSSSAMADLREAMRLGARDYVLKDELCEELIVPIVEDFRERSSLHGEVQRLRARVEHDWGLEALVGSSPPMERLRTSIARAAPADAPVLIIGETGTGKERVARALHQLSARRDRPFVAVNCAAIPGTLLEAHLFGHERGAFTGADKKHLGRMAAADDGTLLLDEIADLSLDVQAKLLRVLEEQKFLPVGADEEVPLRARVLAATNADLAARVKSGQFRSDLYFRLDVVSLRVPSLAERGAGDVVDLVAHFAAELPRKLTFTAPAMDWLVRRGWAGNVRELKNVVRRLSIMSASDVIDVPVLVELVPSGQGAPAPMPVDGLVDAILTGPELGDSRYRTVERALLRRALDLVDGNKSAAARLLGLPRKVLLRRWARLVESPHDEDEDDDD